MSKQLLAAFLPYYWYIQKYSPTLQTDYIQKFIHTLWQFHPDSYDTGWKIYFQIC